MKARSVIAAFLAGSDLGTLRLIRIDSWLMLKEIFYIYNIILFYIYIFFFFNYYLFILLQNFGGLDKIKGSKTLISE